MRPHCKEVRLHPPVHGGSPEGGGTVRHPPGKEPRRNHAKGGAGADGMSLLIDKSDDDDDDDDDDDVAKVAKMSIFIILSLLLIFQIIQKSVIIIACLRVYWNC